MYLLYIDSFEMPTKFDARIRVEEEKKGRDSVPFPFSLPRPSILASNFVGISKLSVYLGHAASKYRIKLLS